MLLIGHQSCGGFAATLFTLLVSLDLYSIHSTTTMADEVTEGRATGPFGIDPLHFSFCLFGLLVLFVLYLSLPRGLRVQYFKAYPKRYAWSARSRARRNGRSILQVCTFEVSLLSRKMMREFEKGPLSHHGGQYLIRDSSRIFVFQCLFL